MKATITLVDGTVTNDVRLRKYTFPKKGTQDAAYSLYIGEEKVSSDVVRTTGGGRYPSYTYFLHEGVSYYLPASNDSKTPIGALETGGRIDLVSEAEPKAEEPKAEEPKAEEPKAEEPKAEEPKAEEPKAEGPKTVAKLRSAIRGLSSEVSMKGLKKDALIALFNKLTAEA